MYEELKLDSMDASARIVHISHNSVLNCLFILTSDNKLILFDLIGKRKLREFAWNQSVTSSANNYLKVFNLQEKCLIVSDRTVCSRFANDGIFLLDTVFQTATNLNGQNKCERVLELALNDAVCLLNAFKSIESMSESIQGLKEITEQLDTQINELRAREKTTDADEKEKGESSVERLKVERWATVIINESYLTLLGLFTQSLDELKRQNSQSISIAILSQLLDRLLRLDSSTIEAHLQSHPAFTNFEKRFMCSEASRRATFNEWPHMDYKWVLPDALAQAGFYHQPTHPGDDRTICFACDLCLVAWEQHDQPWSEHERHSPICQFVRGEITENIPMTITASTQTAHQVFKAYDATSRVECTSELSSERYFAVSNSAGHIIVYDSKDLLKEMMHVQLINESSHNKHVKLRVHSLCFYYRNHKHVLYGAFTINNEVFIFSFNIFDIYRSYNSKSNKKSSKSHHKSTSASSHQHHNAQHHSQQQQQQQQQVQQQQSNQQQSATKIATNVATNTTSSKVNLANSHIVKETVVVSSASTAKLVQNVSETNESSPDEDPITNTSNNKTGASSCQNQSATVGVAGSVGSSGESEFNAYMENISAKSSEASMQQLLVDNQTTNQSAQPIESNKAASSDSTTTPTTPPPNLPLSNQTTVDKADKTDSKQASATPANTPLATQTQTSQESSSTPTTQQSSPFDILHMSMPPQTVNFIQKSFNTAASTSNTAQAQVSAVTALANVIQSVNNSNAMQGIQTMSTSYAVKSTANHNLSNFLNVRFEICTNNQQQQQQQQEQQSASSSKSKSKYKKCIKILSVSCRPLNAIDSGAQVPDIHLKNYEFTEKCLSFRLASIDMSQSVEPRKNFEVKLINVYEKFLCALVNFSTESGQNSFKLYKIKHEENASSSSTTTTTTTLTSTTPTVTNQPTTNTSSSTPSTPVSTSKPSSLPDSPGSTSTSTSCLAATSSSRLNLSEFVLTAVPNALLTHRIVAIMPICITTFDDEVDLKFIAILSDTGVISLIDPIKCCKVFEIPSPNEDNFVSMTYCYGVDNICALTQSGKVLLIPTIVHPLVNQSILDEMSGYLNRLSGMSKTFLVDSIALDTGNTLNHLHNLIYFDSSKLNFSAKLPMCWSPFLSEQHQQRKHPQHILADSINLTKCWKYMLNSSTQSQQNDAEQSTKRADNLNVEIYLNKPVQLGCIQLKLKFSQELDQPYELRLLNPKCRQTINLANVDSIVDFKLNPMSSNTNTNTNECLFGPVDVRDYLDLSGSKAYVITICSSRLYETRSNMFVVNLRVPFNAKCVSSSSANSLQKIQITLRKYKRTGLPNEIIERALMLTKSSFYANVLEHLIRSKDEEQLVKLLDILNWILYNQASNEHFQSMKETLSTYLNKLLVIFYLYGTRSTSRKATLLLSYLLKREELTGVAMTNDDESFASVLMHNLLDLIRFLPHFESAAAMNWYFIMLHQVMHLNADRVFQACTDMLIKLSKGHKYNPFYALLNMRFNFSCLVFESKLFDIDLYFKFDITSVKSSPNASSMSASTSSSGNNCIFSFGSVGLTMNPTINIGNTVNLNTNGSTSTTNGLNNNQIIFGGGGGGGGGAGGAASSFLNSANQFGSNVSSNANALSSSSSRTFYSFQIPQTAGLIEVLPLGFKCIMSSNGTSIDKNTLKQESSIYVLPESFSLLPTQAKSTNNSELKGEQQSTAQNQAIKTNIFNTVFTLNPFQYLIIERMEPVSRHFVVLDFGHPVALTDIMIPASNELSSISIDIWLNKEQKDSKRLCVSTDIGQNALLLNDLQPPAVCRYLKLILVAHSNNTVKARIPVGYYFGYPLLFFTDQQPQPQPQAQIVDAQSSTTTLPTPVCDMSQFYSIPRNEKITNAYLSYLEKLYEDNKCHFSMAIGKLRDLLNEINFPSDNIGHLKMMQLNYQESNELATKIEEAYNECLDYQFQLNLNEQLMKRLRRTCEPAYKTTTAAAAAAAEPNEEESDAWWSYKDKYEALQHGKVASYDVNQMSQDHLRITNNLLIKSLLCLSAPNNVQQQQQHQLTQTSSLLSMSSAIDLFCSLCVHSNLEKEGSLLLLKCCYNEPWWGDFISNCLRLFFVTRKKEVMPLNKIFVTLNDMCMKSLHGSQTENLFRSLFALIEEILKPLNDASECVEVTALEWLLLFISRLISVMDKSKETPNRWEFLENVNAAQKPVTKPMAQKSKFKIRKKLINSHKYFTWNKIKENRKNFEKYKKNWAKSDPFGNGINGASSANSCSHADLDAKSAFGKRHYLPRDISLSVGKLLGRLLISANSYCSSDLFVLSCRLISNICCNTVNSISLSEIFDKNDLNRLILLNVSADFNHGSVCWGSPWSQHALITLCLDLIENDKLNQFLSRSSSDFAAVHSNVKKGTIVNENKSKTSQKSTTIATLMPNPMSSALNPEQYLKIIEEMDENTSNAKQPSSNVKETIQFTGNLAKSLSQLANVLSDHLDQIEAGSNSIDEPFTSGDFNQFKGSSLMTDLFENMMSKKFDEIKNNMVVPLTLLNDATVLSSTEATTNPLMNPIGTPATSQSVNLNKKLSQFQKKQSANSLATHSTNQTSQLLFKFSYDNRTDLSIYQTLENIVFLNVNKQNELINSSIQGPFVPLGNPVQSESVLLLNQDNVASTSAKTSTTLLQETIEALFEDLNNINLENLLTFWLTLCVSDSITPLDAPSSCNHPQPLFQLNEFNANYLIETLNSYAFMSVKLWYLSFKMFITLLHSYNKQSCVFTVFALNASVYKMILKFLSFNQELVGDECCTVFVDFLRQFSKSLANTEYEAHFKKELFNILCVCIRDDGCVSKAYGPIDAQVAFIELLMSEDILKCSDLALQGDETKPSEPLPSSNNTETSMSELSALLVQFFDSLSLLVQYHISIYPRLSVKGLVSPRSCFSGVLTSLLFGSARSQPHHYNQHHHHHHHHQSNQAQPMPNFSIFGSSTTPFNGFNATSSQYESNNIFSSSHKHHPKLDSKQKQQQQAHQQQQRQRSSVLTNTVQSILCNRDMLVCLLLKLAINLIADQRQGVGQAAASMNTRQQQQQQQERHLHQQASEGMCSSSNLNYLAKSSSLSNEHKYQTSESGDNLSDVNVNLNKSIDNPDQENFYEDDMLIQQLFLYELQQIDESDDAALPAQVNTHHSESTAQQMPQSESFDLEFDYENLGEKYDLLGKQSKAAQSANQKPIVDEKHQHGKPVDNEQDVLQRNLIKILSERCLEKFIESLALCQSSALAMVISNSGYPLELHLDDIQTPGDGVFLLLKSFVKEPLKLVNPLFRYLSKINRLSEPLLWLFSALFANEKVVRAFVEKGGIELIAKGLQITTQQLLYSGPCIVSALMNSLDTERQQAKAVNTDTDSTEGFTNFAPLGTIICTNPTGNPVDVLVQNSAQHRRIRSAVWSYHFQPNENKVGLFFTFPYAFLLKEVQILPHTVSFSNCPAYVSIEVSRDGSFLTPIGPPVFTMGMSSIKLQLNKSELVNTIQINLYKAKDSQMIGLSQIRLLGYPMFENMLSAKPDMMLTPVEDLVSRSNMGWLRLLHTCLTSTPALESYVCERIHDSTMLLCTKLLSSPAMIIYDKIIESILIQLSAKSATRSLEISKHLLRVEIGNKGGLYSVPHGILMEAIVNILFEISGNDHDENDVQNVNEQIRSERIRILFEWLSECVQVRLSSASTRSLYSSLHQVPSNMIFHCVACILYKCERMPPVSEQFVVDLIEYSLSINEFYTRQSINWILCAILRHWPQHIEHLTRLIDLSQLRFDSSSSSDGSLSNNESYKRAIDSIEVLSFAIQSHAVIQLFVESEFFKRMNDTYLKVLRHFYSLKRPLETNMIRVYVALAQYEHGQHWLGTEQGCQLWKYFIDILCNASRTVNVTHSEETCLLVIDMIKNMLFCNEANQIKFAEYLKELIREASLDLYFTTLSGFLRQLVIKVLLDDETIVLHFEKHAPFFKSMCTSSLGQLPHPKYGTGNNHRMIQVPLSKTCSQLLSLVTDVPGSQMLLTSSESMSSGVDLEMKDLLSKFKSFNQVKAKRDECKQKAKRATQRSLPRLSLYLKVNDGARRRQIRLANTLTLSQVLRIYLSETQSRCAHDLQLVVSLNPADTEPRKKRNEADDEDAMEEHDDVNERVSTDAQIDNEEEEDDDDDDDHDDDNNDDDHDDLEEGEEEEEECNKANRNEPVFTSNQLSNNPSTLLDAFVKCDGLIVLAECLPTLMPFIHEPLLNVTDKDRMNSQSNNDNVPKTSPDFVDYVIMNESDDPYVIDDMYNEMPSQTATLSSSQANKLKKITMPPHAFIAFGVFLRIPGFAGVLLRNRKQAQCILKLLIGSSKNKEKEFGLSLSTLPFSSLKELFLDTKIKSDDENKEKLLSFILDNGILTLILSILSTLSHHPHRQKEPHFSSKLIPDHSVVAHSTSSQASVTVPSDNEKNSLYWAKGTGFGTGSTMQQWDAEKTMMHQKMEEEHVTYIMDILSSYIECCMNDEPMSEQAVELIDHSCVINSLSSYLRNDSILDMSRHVSLYKSILKLLQSLILSDSLRHLIEQSNIFDLIKNMKQFVDSYIQRIKLSEEGGLTCLVPSLNYTYELLLNFIKPFGDSADSATHKGDLNANDEANIETVYCDDMRSLQFDTYSIVSESDNGSFKALIPYHYESSLNDMNNLNNANRAKRLAQETVTLSNSLPLSYSSSVFVRCDEERLDVLKVLITGPQDTPYANGCFEFDVFFPSDYPESPPMVNLQTTGNQTIRFNPNLYHDGKVCLSILNTWHGRPEERWNAQTSSFLQVLVSIQSLILVSEPYFNEPGYERSRGTPAGTASSIEHDSNIRQATVKWAMLEMIKKPPACFKDVVHKHFYFKRKEIRAQCETWLKEMELHVNDKPIGQSVQKSSTALKRHMQQLFEELDKLKLDDDEDDGGECAHQVDEPSETDEQPTTLNEN